MAKLKITVLKRQDPKDIFDEYPVKERDWFVPCGIYEDGQEYILESTNMPEGFCGSASRLPDQIPRSRPPSPRTALAHCTREAFTVWTPPITLWGVLSWSASFHEH